MEIAFVLGLLVVTIVLFATEKLSVDVVTLLALMILLISGILTPKEAFEGFSDDFIIILAAIFVVSGAMQDTGIFNQIGTQLTRTARLGPRRFLLLVMLIAGSVSAFMNNTTVTALFVGPVVNMSRRLSVSPSLVLMPLSFISILGGTCTLIGTSTNVAVSGYLVRAGFEGVGMFELLPIGLALFGVGLVYLLFVGPLLLPARSETNYIEEYDMRQFLSEIVVEPEARLAGQRIFESDLTALDVRVLKIIRDRRVVIPDPLTVCEPHDLLLVEGKLETLMRLKEEKGLQIRAERLTDRDLSDEQTQLAEALVMPRSLLDGQTLKEADFRRHFHVAVLAIHRLNQNLHEKLGDVRLRVGDMLLLQGSTDHVEALRKSRQIVVLGAFDPGFGRQRRALLTTLFFVAAVVLGSLDIVPLAVAFLGAALAVVLVRSITPERAYQLIEWRLLILIGGMSAFGTAMQKSGASQWLAEQVIYWLEPGGTTLILSGFVLLTVVLTQPLSNAAAALVVLPIALQTATQLGIDPRSFAIAIMLAASAAVITPFEPSCLLVYGPGKYKIMDFLRVGGPLTLLLMLLIVWLVPLLWPF